MPEYGALYDKLPISAFCWKDVKEDVPLTELQLWDCFSYDITIIEKQLLSGNQCKYMSPSKKWYHGHYMFSIDNCNSTNLERNVTYSEVPSQHKSFNILKLDNGQFCLYPNNRMRVYDNSLTPKKPKQPDFKVSTIEYQVENGFEYRLGDQDEYFWK